MTEWSKALVNGTSHFDGVDSSPFPVILLTFLYKVLFPVFEHIHMVSSTTIHAIDFTTYRQDGRVVYSAGLRHQSLRWRGFKSHSCHYVDITIQSIVSCILNTCT